jgi:parvulin-like peptidyl-prolyl isomerase
VRPRALRIRHASFLALFSGVVVVTAASAQQDGETRATRSPAARVNGVDIPQDAVHELVKSVLLSATAPPDSAEIGRLSDAALHSLVDLELLHQEALRRQSAVSDAQVDAEIERVRGHFSDADEFSAALRRSNLSREQLRAETRKTLLVNTLLRTVVLADIEVPEAKVRAFYEQNRDALSEPPAVHLREIVLEAGKDAAAQQKLGEELRAQLAAGADFAELAYNYSIDRNAAARGGDRGFLAKGALPAVVEAAAFQLPIDRISDVLRADDGLHIIQVLARKPGRVPPLEEVRDSIIAVLSDEEREERKRRFVAELRENAEIEVFPPFSPPQDEKSTPPPTAPATSSTGGVTE